MQRAMDIRAFMVSLPASVEPLEGVCYPCALSTKGARRAVLGVIGNAVTGFVYRYRKYHCCFVYVTLHKDSALVYMG